MSAVSIVIPRLNHGHFLGEAVASALGQRGVEREAAVVDDDACG
jgi:hypothetical protein